MKFKITDISSDKYCYRGEKGERKKQQGLVLSFETQSENGEKHSFNNQNTFTMAGEPEQGVEIKTIYRELNKLLSGTGMTCSLRLIPSGSWNNERVYLVLLGDLAIYSLLQEAREASAESARKTDEYGISSFSKPKAEFLFDLLKKNDLIADKWTKETFVQKIEGFDKKSSPILEVVEPVRSALKI